MSTNITNLTELQAMENDLAEDYIVTGNIDASASATMNATTDLQQWQQSMPYVTEDVVQWEGTRKICKRTENRYGALTSYVSKQSFGIGTSSCAWKFRTFRYPLARNGSPTGGIRMSIWAVAADYTPLVELTHYTFPDITDHMYFYEWYSSDIILDRWDIWLTLPGGYEWDIEVDTKYAIVLEPDDTTGSLPYAYRYDEGYPVPPNLPSAATTLYQTCYYHDGDNWIERTYTPNITIYPDSYFLCTEAHTSQTYREDDSTKWEMWYDCQPPSYLGFSPVGDDNTAFTGTFDGGGYTISDLYIGWNIRDDVGLLGVTDGATIEDVTLSNAVIKGFDNTGVLIGYAEDSTITDCHTTGTLSYCSPLCDTPDDVGGLIGDADGCTISDCSAVVSVSGGDHVGGLIGFSHGTSTVEECFATGNVTCDDSSGGLIGYSYSTTVEKCYAKGNVTGDDLLGGLIGDNGNSTITNCYARGNVTGDRYIAGLIAYSYNTSTVTNCFSTGLVTYNSYHGGLIEENTGTDTACFWDTQTSGTETSDGGTGKTTHLMKSLGTFHLAGWDIAQTTTNRNDGYPFLSWEIDETDTVWKIYGWGYWDDGDGSGFTFPDLMDDKGRRVKNVPITATRADSHQVVETQYTDEYGSTKFLLLPAGQDIVFDAIWGGVASAEKQEWFYMDFKDLEEGGTGGATAPVARDNLGVSGVSLLWELVLGD